MVAVLWLWRLLLLHFAGLVAVVVVVAAAAAVPAAAAGNGGVVGWLAGE